jgi:hypothetical protein
MTHVTAFRAHDPRSTEPQASAPLTQMLDDWITEGIITTEQEPSRIRAPAPLRSRGPRLRPRRDREVRRWRSRPSAIWGA